MKIKIKKGPFLLTFMHSALIWGLFIFSYSFPLQGVFLFLITLNLLFLNEHLRHKAKNGSEFAATNCILDIDTINKIAVNRETPNFSEKSLRHLYKKGLMVDRIRHDLLSRYIKMGVFTRKSLEELVESQSSSFPTIFEEEIRQLEKEIEKKELLDTLSEL